MAIELFSLVSPLHDTAFIDRTLKPFLTALEKDLENELVYVTLHHMQQNDLTLILIKSGGVEEQFKEIYLSLREPFVLLASSLSNSLAASMEILAFLQQRGLKGEILHGCSENIAGRIKTLKSIATARKRLSGTRLGVIGKPSGWLIASHVNYEEVKEKFGIELIDIEIEELFQEIGRGGATTCPSCPVANHADSAVMDQALLTYTALRRLIERYGLQGLTLRCFDMLDRLKSTGCLALALLNSESIPSACEGDVPSLLSMVILNYLAHKPVFMANPSSIDCQANTMVLAHCTVPLSMVESYEYDTHFESSLGLAVRGSIPAGRGTLFRLASDLTNFYLSGIDVLHAMSEPDLCRTQIKVKPDRHVSSFLTAPMGNHHLFCQGDYKHLVKEFLLLS